MVVVFTPHFVLGVTMLIVWAVITRVAYVLVSIWFGGPTEMPKGSTIKTLVVLGSGGHTGEMLKLIHGLDALRYRPFVYVVAKTDQLSRDRLEELQRRRKERDSQALEKSTHDDSGCHEIHSSVEECSGPSGQSDSPMSKYHPGFANFTIEVIPRSREVGQSYFTSVFTTVIALLGALKVVIKHRPDLILVNGPGSCIPICISGLLLRILALCKGRITFVESLCRVRSVSLTGKILYWFSDDFIVQWPELKGKYPRSKYFGRLV